MTSRLVAVGLLCALSACAGTIRVDATVVHPAALELAGMQSITVVHGVDEYAIAIATELVTELRSHGVTADLRSSAAPASELRGTLLVLDVEVDIRMRTEWTTRPENVCGPYGCYVRNVSQPMDMPYLVARYGARLFDAVTRTALESTSGTTEVMGGSDSAVRRRLIAQVLDRLVEAMQPHEERLRISFESVDDGPIDAAIEQVRQGRFDVARDALTARLAAGETDERKRARLHYDLSLVLAFDPESRTRETAFDEAVANAEASVRFDPTSRHIDSLARVRMLAAEARVENDRRSRAPSTSGAPLPDVPDAYRGVIPPAP